MRLFHFSGSENDMVSRSNTTGGRPPLSGRAAQPRGLFPSSAKALLDEGRGRVGKAGHDDLA
jgi:hypothetical protein